MGNDGGKNIKKIYKVGGRVGEYTSILSPTKATFCCSGGIKLYVIL